METVRLDILPSTEPAITILEIYEASDPAGPWTLIDTITPVGSYPNYVSYVESENATSLGYWFAIQWKDDAGWVSGLSEAVQGRTGTLVGKLISRVLLSAPMLNEIVVSQSAEFVVSQVMHTENPYDPTLSPTYRQMEAMTLLTQAQAMVRTIASGTGQSSGWTAGLVSMKSSSDPAKTTQELIGYLTEIAAGYLGLNVGVVAQMMVPELAGGLSEIIREDVSRLELVEEV